jgi:glycosyltransferase involved in cell wall biosynthesis
LKELTSSLHLEAMIEFDDRYMSRERLARLVRSADVVVLPYESMEQVTSGVLVEAIAASKPVVATEFPHAVELLSPGAGTLVPYGEPHRLADELRRILSDRGARSLMARRAQTLAADWYWPTVGGKFAEMMADIGGVDVPFATPVLDGQRVAG